MGPINILFYLDPPMWSQLFNPKVKHLISLTLTSHINKQTENIWDICEFLFNKWGIIMQSIYLSHSRSTKELLFLTLKHQIVWSLTIIAYNIVAMTQEILNPKENDHVVIIWLSQIHDLNFKACCMLLIHGSTLRIKLVITWNPTNQGVVPLDDHTIFD